MVYLDHNATSPPRPEVLEAALPYVGEHWGNPASTHAAAREPARALEEARAQVATWAAARPRDVVFTSGATEANHLALHGVDRVAVSAVEHASVLAARPDAVRLAVEGDGRLDLRALDEALAGGLDVVSVQAANNETGVLQELGPIAERVHAAGALLHVDAVQVVGRLELDLSMADLVSVSGHKAGGLKGAGALVVRRGEVQPLLRGGSQERGRRAGTVNVAACVALGAVLALEVPELPDIGPVLACAASLGGRATVDAPTLPNTLHLCFDLPGDALVMALDREGVCVSNGSACASGAAQPSHVLQALGRDPRAGLRVSTGWNTTAADLDALVSALRVVVPRTREALA